MPKIETARLRLTQYTLDDLDNLAQILSNPQVIGYSPRGSIPKAKVKQTTQKILEFFIKHF